MEIELIRKKPTQYSMGGKIAIDGVFQCYSLERSPIDPDFKPIPEGKYLITIRFSPKFGQDMIHLENVPGREGIEIHWGNHATDSHGCILAGKQLGEDEIWESRVAVKELHAKIAGCKESVFIVVKNKEEEKV